MMSLVTLQLLLKLANIFFFNEENETYLRQISLLKQAKEIQKGMHAKEVIFTAGCCKAEAAMHFSLDVRFLLHRAWYLKCSIYNCLSY